MLSSVFALLILSGAVACAGGPAGTVLYHRDGDSVFLLLANDSKGTRGWSAFGGGAEAGETIRETAARETEEETRGYFSRTWLAERIANQKPLRSRGYHMYFVEVPFVPAQRVMNNPVDDNQAAMKETQFYAWIPLSELESALSKDNPSEADLRMNALYVPRGCESRSFWRVWVLNMRDAQKQAAEMQKNMARVQSDLAERIVEGTSGGGMVKAFVNGNRELVAVKITPEVVDPDEVEMLEDLVTAAVTAGMKKAGELHEQEMNKLTGGLNLPGFS